jgi:hypothetical protein
MISKRKQAELWTTWKPGMRVLKQRAPFDPTTAAYPLLMWVWGNNEENKSLMVVESYKNERFGVGLISFIHACPATKAEVTAMIWKGEEEPTL